MTMLAEPPVQPLEPHDRTWPVPHVGMPPLDTAGNPLSDFEFWSMPRFYWPIALYSLWLMVRYRGITLPTSANPSFSGGGFSGESKSAILDLAYSAAPDHVAPFIAIDRPSDPDDVVGEALAAEAALTAAGLGFRGQIEYMRPYGQTLRLPITEALYLGGEYTIRGFDIRSIGPRDPLNPYLVLGGNKSLLFNAEYLVSIAGPVRLVLFFDAGQVRDVGEPFAWREDVTRTVDPGQPPIIDPFTNTRFKDPNAPPPYKEVIGQTYAFKASTGAEVRFFMPVLNVPFRLIFAHNPQRDGVLDNNFQPQKAFQFRFAVGTTF